METRGAAIGRDGHPGVLDKTALQIFIHDEVGGGPTLGPEILNQHGLKGLFKTLRKLREGEAGIGRRAQERGLRAIPGKHPSFKIGLKLGAPRCLRLRKLLRGLRPGGKE